MATADVAVMDILSGNAQHLPQSGTVALRSRGPVSRERLSSQQWARQAIDEAGIAVWKAEVSPQIKHCATWALSQSASR